MPKLGLVIIDEQHKFGVAQRETLVRKGNYPHLLVMTATPIPRTLGLTLYGDLDVSVIDEMPGGRGQIKTFVRMTDKLPKVFEFIREKISGGRQAYIVYPRVEVADTDKDIKAVTKEFENVQRALTPFKVGLLHGRIKPADKEKVMADFRANKIQALVATSLIEVGVDVPNASVMLIENAEHFGLAQLHQLRGRIGRGAHESFCILISDAQNEEAQARLKILEETNDGFKIAEADLKLRGPGELLGQAAKRRDEAALRKSGGGFEPDPAGARAGGEEFLAANGHNGRGENSVLIFQRFGVVCGHENFQFHIGCRCNGGAAGRLRQQGFRQNGGRHQCGGQQQSGGLLGQFGAGKKDGGQDD